MMSSVYAPNTDYHWGQRPCEGKLPSNLTCVWDGKAARHTHPGLGVACMRSNDAEMHPFSYGGQFRPEKEKYNEQFTPSSSASTPAKAIQVANSFYDHCLYRTIVRLAIFTLGITGVLITAARSFV